MIVGADGADHVREPGRRARPGLSGPRTASADRPSRRPSGRPRLGRAAPRRRRRDARRRGRRPSSGSRHADGSWRWLEVVAQEPARRPGRRRHRRQLPRRHRRASLEDELRHQAFHDSLTGLANRALFIDRLEHALSRQPRLPARAGGAVRRPRRLQDRQRQPGPRGGRRAARRGRRRGCRRRSARRHDRPDGRRRVRGPGRGPGRRATSPIEVARRAARRARAAVRPGGQRALRPGERRHRGVRGRATSPPTSCSATRTSRCTRPRPTARTGRGLRAEHARGRRGAGWRSRGDLERAVERSEFFLLYQPIVRAGEPADRSASRRSLRWRAPGARRRSARPSSSRVAEETGLIVPLGRWVLEEACRQARGVGRGRSEPPLTMNVNVSGTPAPAAGLRRRRSRRSSPPRAWHPSASPSSSPRAS